MTDGYAEEKAQSTEPSPADGITDAPEADAPKEDGAPKDE